MELEDKMAIGWNETINFGVGKEFKDRAKRRRMNGVKESNPAYKYKFSKEEIQGLKELMDEPSEQETHFDGEDFTI
jgi:Glu-tRNA(Gln) amidotransferase subunit E-like FAD-binding protein